MRGLGNGGGSTDPTLFYVKHLKGYQGDTVIYLPVVQQLSGDKVMCDGIDPKITNDN